MKYVDPPFELGETLSGTDDNSKPINHSWLGQKFFIPAQRLTGGPKSAKGRHTGKGICAVILRNISGIALPGGRLAQLAYGTAGASTVTVGSTTYNETNIAAIEGVDGLAVVTAQRRVVLIDPWLPSGTTVADNDIFWGIIGGRALCKTNYAQAASGSISVGDYLVAGTGSTTGSTTEGGVEKFTATSNNEFEGANNFVGYALSARTSGETNSDILVDLCIQY